MLMAPFHNLINTNMSYEVWINADHKVVTHHAHPREIWLQNLISLVQNQIW